MHTFAEPGRPKASSRIAVSIVPIHASVPGRARLKVGGLQGSSAVKDLLERGGRAAPGVSSLTGSDLTGTILVEFEATSDLDAIIDHLAALLRGEIVAPSDAPHREWHAVSPGRLSSMLEVSADAGLSRDNALGRLASIGPNVLDSIQPRSSTTILAGQFESLPVAMLLGAAAISILTGGVLEAAAIVAVVGLNAAIGYQTESRAERTIQGLGAKGSRTAQVTREGVTATIPVQQIVPGDIISVQRGDVVPADARLVNAQALSVSEAMLTGESAPISKTVGTIRRSMVPLGARSNMIYRGTIVTGGSGHAIVVATGSLTQVGQIQRLVGATLTPETPIQRELKNLGQCLGWLTLGACAFLVLVGGLRGLGVLQMARSALSVAVAAVPEGLPMVATTTFALGVERLRREGVLIRKLDAIETLAAVRVACFDKTGTLTFGRISVETIRIGDKAYPINDVRRSGADPQGPLRSLLETCCLCNDTEIVRADKGLHLSGSPTESCLIEAALDSGVDVASLRGRFARISVQQRSEVSRLMATRHMTEDGMLIAMKGSPDEVLRRCGAEIRPDGTRRELTPDRRAAIEKANLEMASRALRVLGVARKQTSGSKPTAEDTQDLVWLGLVGMADRLRPGVSTLMGRLHEAGIHTIMLTGDQKATAAAVGERVGLNGGGKLAIVDSTEIEGMSSEEFVLTARRAQAFSRVSPSQKLEIVRSLQEAGARVAMIGDGVNDGPALKAADVGIAIGRDNMSAAREIADVIIDADGLGGLAPAIETGRTTRRNIRKTLRYLISTNLSEIMLVLAGTSIGMRAPFTPMQLLWINLISDVLPGIGLTMEAPEPDILRQALEKGDSEILPGREFGSLTAQATIMGGAAMAAGLFGAFRYGLDSPRTRTMTFGSLVIAQLLHAITSRSDSESIFGPRSRPPNHALSLIIGGSMAVQTAGLFVPFLRRLLGIAPITGIDALITLAGGTLPFLTMEWMKSGRDTVETDLVWTRKTERTVLPGDAAPPPKRRSR
ncbi:cation-transporting P-type ATPase [Sinorhizobium numidicum]|uniref:Cation-transporting P-type ATPase n=1 Tax=Sinorhizobium numidicum TaxID=680248 RepID=A0ABY8CQ69_9HYPH|nr:cation-transporting P-type ATPase [Sinorhizobium numidicum]WEX74811.1 cation-transporting P-type ATPase [Sinorhizobium numidicum]WEX80804.1 cation-transporting P-type ATPase [Sinorhizobium numidicum]